MTITNKMISKGFVLAGLMNITGAGICSRLFTNETIPEFDPTVMSNFGLLMIMIWGLAYISVAEQYDKVKWLVAVFAVEKLIYGIAWIKWLSNHELSAVFEEDVMAGVFYSIYGLNDWMFCLFFLFVFVRLSSFRK